VSRRLWFIVESGTDVRLIEGLAERWPLTVTARRVVGGREISQDTTARFEMRIGPASFARFGAHAAVGLLRHRRRIGVVVVQGYGIAALCANIAGLVARVPVVMLVCSPTEAYYGCRRIDGGARRFRQAEWVGLRLLAWLNARLGRQYIVLSGYLEAIVRGHGTSRPVDVVPIYGVDPTVFSPSGERRDDLRRRLGLPVEPFLAFFSSRIAPEKDPDTLLAAVAALRGAGRDVRILHRSGGHAEFVRRAHAHGVREAVIAGPAIPPGQVLADYYRASDVCVQASREEGLGFSPLEALACGVPVVAAAVGGLRETIIEGRTGRTYDPGDVQSLARALVNVLDDPVAARHHTEQGRALVARAYAREVVFAQLAGIIEPLLLSSRARDERLAASL
jgi:glycosyltransferase involved in cell wall biosynthesis